MIRLILEKLREVIVGDSDPENVILLEIEPEKQKTYIDFLCTEKFLGVKPVCLTKIMQRRKKAVLRKGRKENPH